MLLDLLEMDVFARDGVHAVKSWGTNMARVGHRLLSGTKARQGREDFLVEFLEWVLPNTASFPSSILNHV